MAVARNFQLTFQCYRLMNQITKNQVFFLDYLVSNGLIKNFRTRDIKIAGMYRNSAWQFLIALKKINFISKSGLYWSVTDKGQTYYHEFMKKFDYLNNSPFRWKA
ncbi:MAG: hypothetical protein M0Q38_09940 [Bacteroidales bacterium]|nr:hypothetical protein [Bacteroidales bacterium]